MQKLAMIVATLMLVLVSANRVNAQCSSAAGSGCGSAAKVGKECPVDKALKGLTLTAEQEKKIAAAKTELTGSIGKASSLCCPASSKKAKHAAKDAFVTKVKAALTEEQQKTFSAALPAKKCCGTCSGAKAKSGCTK